jgi:cytochrome b561
LALREGHYHSVAKYLHWSIAALVVLQLVLAKLAENAVTPLGESTLLANHKSVGITIFALAIARLFWRVRQGAPRSLSMPPWQATASRISHWSMYVLILLLPVSGWLKSSASASSVSWFNLVSLPNLVAAEPGLRETLESVHSALAYLLFLIAFIHIAAALKHSLFDKNAAIARITSAGSLVLFALLIAAGIAALTGAGTNSSASKPGMRGNAEITQPTSAEPEIIAWNIDYESSYIRYVAEQAGAEINGEWQDWRADLQFDASNL